MLQEPWHITLLGGLRAEQPSRTVPRFRTRQAGALLARLALSPRRDHPREELADLLWPGDAPEAARAKLRIALSSLRRQLEPPGTHGLFHADRHCVRLQAAAFVTDVARFEAALARADGGGDARRARLGEALALYGGELLPGFYEDWVVDERHRLAALHEAAQREWEAAAEPSVTAAAPEAPPSPPSVDSVRLPPTWTRFFGRERELQRIASWLDASADAARLVTLTGMGGAGKTRLALEAARRTADRFPQAVCFVGLADTRRPERVWSQIGERLGLTPPPRGEWRAALRDALGDGPALLLLDNLEQIGPEVAPPLMALLEDLPLLKILATSRRHLGVPGERVLPVGPLPAPAPATLARLSPADLAAFPAVQMFLDRAQTGCPDLGVTPHNAPALGGLCAHLEGLPLALELAAAWSGVLTPAQMLERLQEKSLPLRGRGRAGAGRHGSLQAAMDWNFDLLPPDLQDAWARLSAFRGGWTPEAMQAVCPAAPALETLARLRERSLVLADETSAGETNAGGMRFRMLESLRDDAQNRLAPADAGDAARRHAAFFQALAAESRPHLQGPEQPLWLSRLDADDANLRAACRWLLAHDAAAAVQMGIALWRYHERRGRHAESLPLLTAALAAAPDAPALLQAEALGALGSSATTQGDWAAARSLHERALALWREAGHRPGIAVALHNLAMVAQRENDLARAAALYRRSCAIARSMGDQHGRATSLNNLGRIAFARDDMRRARAFYERSLAIKRTLGDINAVANALGNLGTVAQHDGDVGGARAFYQECLALKWQLRDPVGVALTLLNVGDLARLAGDWPRAALLFAAAEAAQEGLLAQFSPSDSDAHGRALAQVREALGPAAFEAAQARGRAMTTEEAVALAQTED